MKNIINLEEAKAKNNQKDALRKRLEILLVVIKLLHHQKLTKKDQEIIINYYKAMTLFGGLQMIREEAKVEAYSLIESYIGDLSLLYSSDLRRMLFNAYDACQNQEENVQFKM